MVAMRASRCYVHAVMLRAEMRRVTREWRVECCARDGDKMRRCCARRYADDAERYAMMMLAAADADMFEAPLLRRHVVDCALQVAAMRRLRVAFARLI